MKNNILKICGLIGFTCLSVLSFTSKKEDNNVNFQDNPKYECVNLADQLLNDYYGDVKAANEGKEICTFDEFCTTYKESYLDIEAFTEKVCKDPLLQNSDYIFNVPVKKSSGDENYVIGKNKSWKDTGIPKTAFKRKPIYRNYYDIYSLRNCDIIYESFTIFGSIGHAACITQYWTYTNESNVDDRMGYCQTIEAVGSGVNYGFLDDERICKFGVLIYRYNQSLKLAQKTKITNFLANQVGENYFLASGYNPEDSNDTWMCSTLVEAAYENANIKLFDNPHYVLPDELVTSSKIHLVDWLGEFLLVTKLELKYDFLFFGKHYDATIYNNTYDTLTVTYTKVIVPIPLTGIDHWSYSTSITDTVTIPSQSSKTVRVNTKDGPNGFACMYTNNSRYTSDGYKKVDFITVKTINGIERFVYKEN